MSLRLNGSTSGYSELEAPAVAGSNTIVLPASNGSANNLLKNSGTAGTLEFASNVNIDSSGRLLVGTSTSASIGGLQSNIQAVGASAAAGSIGIRRDTNDTGTPYLSIGKSRGLGSIVVLNNDPLGEVRFSGADGTDTDTVGATITAYVDGTPGANSMPGRIVLSTTASGASSPTQRMKILSQGQLGAFSDTSHVFLTARASNTTGSHISFQASASDLDTGTQTCLIRANGNIENQNNSYGSLSDARLKENIVDANSQWEDLKAIQIRNYNYKLETNYNTDTQLGLIAQEVERISPGLVTDSIDETTGDTIKSIKYSVLYMKAVKALQEAMERIETLEASNADLVARITALEVAS